MAKKNNNTNINSEPISSTEQQQQSGCAQLLTNRPTSLTLNHFEDEINMVSSDLPVYRETVFSSSSGNGKRFMMPSSPTSSLDIATISDNDKKNSFNAAIPQYACTVNNVTFTYGRGKKAVNALDDITLNVPVGSMCVSIYLI